MTDRPRLITFWLVFIIAVEVSNVARMFYCVLTDRWAEAVYWQVWLVVVMPALVWEWVKFVDRLKLRKAHR